MKTKPKKDTKNAVVVREHGQIVAPPAGTPEALIHQIGLAAADPNVDIAKMERLYAMHKDMLAGRAEQQFNESFARAQEKIQPVAAKYWNDQTKSRFSKLEAINRMALPIWTVEGFSLSFNTVKPEQDKWIRIEGILSHKGGHTRKYYVELPPDEAGFKGNANKTGVQAAGSTNSYGRRYLTMMIWNVTTFDDQDGNAGGTQKTLDESTVANHLAAIEAAATRADVTKAFKIAYTLADDINDKASRRQFIDKKNERMKALGFEV